MTSRNWPADNVEKWSIDRLVPYARNARTHDEKQVAQIAASIREWGWTIPILVDEQGTIIAGHGRVLAARQLGIKEAPVMVARGWSEAQMRAYVLADNRLAENAGWDKQILMLEVDDLTTLGFDLSLVGFSDRELTSFAAAQYRGLCDPDEVPEAPAEPVSQVGDVWVLGAHRLVCGDCTDAAVVQCVLAGVSPHLMVTDPPYGVNYDPSWRGRSGLSEQSSLATGQVLNDNRSDWRDAWALFPGDVAYVWHSALHAAAVARSLEAAGFVIRSQIIWDKTRLVVSRGDYHWRHEPALYVVRKGKPGHWSGDRKQTTIWEIPHRKSETGHGTEKPVECMKRPIENNSSPGQAVYDPFSGSGTTLIAAEITSRVCHAIELSPAYVDVAVERWRKFTGKTAVHEPTKHSFEELSVSRRETNSSAPQEEAAHART
jgi:DNA modification methylase